MKLSAIYESKWVEVVGGANTLQPQYEWPWSHPHKIHDDPGIWMHGTSDIYLDSANKYGLDATKSDPETRTSTKDIPQVHMTKDRRLARSRAIAKAQRVGGLPIIIHVDASKLANDLMGTKTDSNVREVPKQAISKIEKLRLSAKDRKRLTNEGA